MPMHSYTKRREPHFVSSDSSLAIRRPETISPRVCNNLPSSSTYKLTSEKTVTLPKGNTKVLVVDSSGEKHTTLVDTNEVQNIDIRKVIKMEEDNLKSIYKEKLFRKGNERSKERFEDIKRKLTKTRLYKNRALCHKSRKIASFSKGSIGTYPSYSNPRLTQSTSTQTENLDITIANEDRHLIGLRRSSSRIFYQDNENIHRNQEAPSLPPKQAVNPAAGDGNKFNRTEVNLSNVPGRELQNVPGREQQVQKDSLRDIFNNHTATNIQPAIMNPRNLAKYRTAQRFSTVESSRPKRVDGSCLLIRELKKFNRNGNLRRALSVILFAAMLSWFFQAVFRISFPTDIFRAIVNYVFSLPIFVKRRRRELTKVEIVVKYIGNFFRFLGNIFSN